MEDPCSPFNWDFCAYEEEKYWVLSSFAEFAGMEELWYSHLCRTSELDTKVALAKGEIIKKEEELVHLKDFLSRALKERDEAESKCQSIMLDILVLQQQLQQQKYEQEQQKQDEIGAQIEMEPQAKESHLVDQHFPNCFDTDHGSGNIIIEPEKESWDLDLPHSAEKLVAGKAMPEKGKLLQAVMEAGPLLAGPLPQWQHPPPRVDSIEIPLVASSRPPKQSFLCQVSVAREAYHTLFTLFLTPTQSTRGSLLGLKCFLST